MPFVRHGQCTRPSGFFLLFPVRCRIIKANKTSSGRMSGRCTRAILRLLLFDPELILFDISQAAARVRVCLDRLGLAGYDHAGEGRYVMFVSVPIPSVLRRDSSSTGQARSVKDGGRLQFFFIFPLDKH